jgi:N-acyl-D-amino-acid deacylase
VALLLLVAVVASSRGEDAKRDAKIKEAIDRGLKVVTRGATAYPEHRQCFSCHHQTLPLQAMSLARAAGYDYDQDAFKQQLEFTNAFFAGKHETLARGERIGGAAATVSYGLWTYDMAEVGASEVTDAMVKNLLELQQPEGQWVPPSMRPPLEESHITCTVLSAYGLQKFARGADAAAAKLAFDKASAWIDAAKPETTEDLSFALLWYTCFRSDQARASAIHKRLMAEQRADGGWGQREGMESDAYATGQALTYTAEFTLADKVSNKRAVDFLLSTQQEDGSWHVKTRSKPVQKFFDNGDPHGNDQFISMAATSWATTALIMDNFRNWPSLK